MEFIDERFGTLNECFNTLSNEEKDKIPAGTYEEAFNAIMDSNIYHIISSRLPNIASYDITEILLKIINYKKTVNLGFSKKYANIDLSRINDDGRIEQANRFVNCFYSNNRIYQNKILVISDPHIGRLQKFEDDIKENQFISTILDESNDYFCDNELGLFKVYDYARRNGINVVINLGDMIEGTSDSTWKEKLKRKFISIWNYLRKI